MQRRHSKEQVLAKIAELDLDREVSVGGRQNAHVGGNGSKSAEPPHFAVLESAKQLGLQLFRQLAELVEKQRSAVGLLEHPRTRSDGPREGAALVAEKLDSARVGVTAPQSKMTYGLSARELAR